MTPDVASREVLWNVNTTTTVVAMYSFMVLSLLVAAVGIIRRAELWASGKPAPRYWGSWAVRVADLVDMALLQRGTVRERTPAIFHTLIYVGFLVLLFTTTMVFIDHDLGIRIYQGDFYLFVTLISDLFGFGFLVGLGIAAHRRYIRREGLLHSSRSDAMFLIVLALLIIQGFVLEGLRIHITADPWARYSPIGWLFSLLFWSISYHSARVLHLLMWWFHTLTVFSAIALAPYTKMFHIISSSLNLFFRRGRGPLGAMEPVGDLEALMESGEEFSIGLGTIKDYSWKQLLDLDACTSCGRCQNVCPAYLSGKPLSPKWIILDTRNHARALQAQSLIGGSRLIPPHGLTLDSAFTEEFLLRESGLEWNEEKGGYLSSDLTRSGNKSVQDAVRLVGHSVNDKIAGDVIDPMAFWSCTSCLACVEACPVGINQLDQILGNRRYLALMEGEIPTEAQGTLRAIETRGNPYGPADDRIKWAAGLDVKILQPGDSVEVLYWVGCISAYDQRKQKIARSLVSIMNRAGISYGILGNREMCTGDPARRLGEENLYQMMVKQNLEVLRSVKFSTIVANCPHCFNTLKNEYPEFGNFGQDKAPEIVHHSAFLQRLIAEQRLSLSDAQSTITFHDPCYLGRYNNEYDAPRDVLVSIGGLKIEEMAKSRNKGMCCGAGGGHFWMDLKQGERINALRVDQAAATHATQIATACPFCLQMMEDGVKLTDREGKLEVKDIAEFVAENLA